MNVLLLTTVYPTEKKPSYCIFIQQIAEALLQVGAGVTVISFRSDIAEEKFFNNNGVDILEMPYVQFNKANIIKYFYQRTENLISHITKNIKIETFDIIYLHFFDLPTMKLTYALTKKYSAKLFMQYHGLIDKKKCRSITQFIGENTRRIWENRLVKKSTCLIGVSSKLSEQIKERYPSAKVCTQYNGVSTDIFTYEEYKNVNFIISCVGNLIDTKGQKYLIEAFKKCIDYFETKTLELYIVGEGINFENYKEMVRNYNIEDKVHFTGRVDYHVVANILKKSYIFVLPSYYEALGCVYLEAMACKVPVVGCEGQGIDGIIIDGKNGYLVPEKDAESIFCIMKKLIINKKLHDDIGQAGYDLVQNKYTWADTGKDLMLLFSDAL